MKYVWYAIWAILLIIVLILIYKVVRRFNPKYFSWSEFDSPDKKGSGKKYMSKTFVHKLDLARGKLERGWNKDNPEDEITFSVNSGYRTKEHNAKVGGVPNSAHTTGHAADLAWRKYSRKAQEAIVKALFDSGIVRFGLANGFLHIDDDETKSQFAYWSYGNIAPFNPFTLA